MPIMRPCTRARIAQHYDDFRVRAKGADAFGGLGMHEIIRGTIHRHHRRIHSAHALLCILQRREVGEIIVERAHLVPVELMDLLGDRRDDLRVVRQIPEQ